MNEYGFEVASLDEMELERKPARFKHEDLFVEAEGLEDGSCLVKEFGSSYEANNYAVTLRNSLNAFRIKDKKFSDLKVKCRMGKVFITKVSEP